MTLAAIGAALFMAALDQTVLATALAEIAADLRTTTDISWVVSSYLLASCASAPLIGALSDILGRRRIFLTSMFCFVLGSVLVGASPSLGFMIAARVVQGAAAGGLMSLVLVIIADLVPARELGRYQGYLGAIFGVASVTGPLVSGFAVEYLSWHWVFWMNVPLGVAACVVVARSLPAVQSEDSGSVDLRAAALLLFCCGFGGFGLQAVAGTGQVGYGLAAVALAVLAGFVLTRVERYVARPLLPREIFVGRTFQLCVLIGFTAGGTVMTIAAYLPSFFQLAAAVSPVASGLMLLPLIFGQAMGAWLGGALVTRTGRYKFLVSLGLVSQWRVCR